MVTGYTYIWVVRLFHGLLRRSFQNHAKFGIYKLGGAWRRSVPVCKLYTSGFMNRPATKFIWARHHLVRNLPTFSGSSLWGIPLSCYSWWNKALLTAHVLQWTIVSSIQSSLPLRIVVIVCLGRWSHFFRTDKWRTSTCTAFRNWWRMVFAVTTPFLTQ
jgi:hypothetical protein